MTYFMTLRKERIELLKSLLEKEPKEKWGELMRRFALAHGISLSKVEEYKELLEKCGELNA